VADGELGKKTGKGFYVWRDGEPVKGSVTTQPNPEIIDRLILPMLNVCVACLREGIVADEEVTDGAMIFGTGFAPFRGGPLHYARARGGDEIVLTLQRLEDKYGPRFVPDAGWDRFTTRK
jgi:3-hydroxyacyl-CoA dehydrogenase/enoyl-CoA hydratase/3-hydroxybutyryl-CoA epimerase